MRILVTGGTGVIGESVVRGLHARGHGVRVLSRHAGRGEKWWPEGIEGWAGDVANEPSLRGSAEGCEVVLHIAGIVDEQPPERTFQRVNIDGTRYVVLEAERAGARKMIYVSSLGAERGQSPYHKSKYVAEDVVRAFSRDWVILRPGAVYGPGDESLSVLLRMVRTLPIVPTIGDGNQQFEPIWHEDLAKALVAAAERDDVRCQVLDIVGPERTSQNDLVARLRKLTGRSAPQLPLPEMFASWGLRALDALGVNAPFASSQLDMLAEGNVIPPGRANALTSVFGIAPTRLDDGLRRLVDEQPAQLPSEGVGVLIRKRYWVDTRGSRFTADELFTYVKAHLAELMPPLVGLQAEPHAPARVEEGETLTFDIPLRGHIQVRVAEAADRRITFLTLSGHPVAGAVRFQFEPVDDAIRFEIQVYDRAANVIDQLALRAVGQWLQRETWIGFAENVARASGGTSGKVQSIEDELDAHEAEVVNEWASTLNAQLSAARPTP